ncbi:polygalacturonase-2-like [Carex rostrata]
MLTALAIVGLCFLFMIKFATARHVYNVVDYQAAGNGRTDDTRAFLMTWNDACKDERSPILLFPSGKNFLINKIRLEGPCRSNITIQVDGNVTAPNKIWTKETTNLITFYAIDNLVMNGWGTIDGQGAIWWDCFKRAKCSRPYLLEFVNCQNLVVKHVRLTNSPNKHLVFDGCNNLTVHGVTIMAPGDSPNTDGIVMQGCQQVQIARSKIGTGDDCIAILTNCSDVDISGITCGPGHGISIGSLGKDSEAMVERIHVHDSNIFQALTGLRIKTWEGGSGFARNITFERIRMMDLKTPIVIDQSYGTMQLSDVAISDIAFKDINGTSTEEVVVKLECSASVPCTDLTFENIIFARAAINNTVSATIQNAYGTTNGTLIPILTLAGRSKNL